MTKRILLLGLILLTGCSFFVKKPEISVKGVNLAGLGDDGVEIDFLLSVANPNSYGIKLTGYSYTLIASDLKLANGENRDTVDFKGNTATDIMVPVTIAFKDLMAILNRRSDSGQIPYQLTADFTLHAPLGTVEVPLRKSGSLTVPRKINPGKLLKQLNDMIVHPN